MIFVSVGHQMPFDRMLALIEEWSGRHERSDVFAQIGESGFQTTRFETRQWLTPQEYRDRLERCTQFISHAGTGNIIQALGMGKPMLIFPRRADLHETRNDHQVGTARYFESRELLMAAYDAEGFRAALEGLEGFRPRARLGDYASEALTDRIRGFIGSVG
jgi:UDP-N-acetylglucosamine transferase subunit ALG13